jgi:blocked-early-in-transport protein 1
MNEDFDTTGSLLTGSLKRVKAMASAGHNRWMLYLILFVLLVFFICYYIIRWRS